jgi:hypothetical protein
MPQAFKLRFRENEIEKWAALYDYPGEALRISTSSGTRTERSSGSIPSAFKKTAAMAPTS